MGPVELALLLWGWATAEVPALCCCYGAMFHVPHCSRDGPYWDGEKVRRSVAEGKRGISGAGVGGNWWLWGRRGGACRSSRR